MTTRASPTSCELHFILSIGYCTVNGPLASYARKNPHASPEWKHDHVQSSAKTSYSRRACVVVYVYSNEF